eukprot:7588132-Pyramimonas_sp.AAC.1
MELWSYPQDHRTARRTNPEAAPPLAPPAILLAFAPLGTPQNPSNGCIHYAGDVISLASERAVCQIGVSVT